MQSIKTEAQNQHGLNGFILLVHIGTDPRCTDKFYDYLDELLNFLADKRYTLQRVDTLLAPKSSPN